MLRHYVWKLNVSLPIGLCFRNSFAKYWNFQVPFVRNKSCIINFLLDENGWKGDFQVILIHQIKIKVFHMSVYTSCHIGQYTKCDLMKSVHNSVSGQILNFFGGTFHILLTKSATLNRLLHCSLWQFSGALFLYLRGLFFAFRGRNRPESLYIFPPHDVTSSEHMTRTPPAHDHFASANLVHTLLH